MSAVLDEPALARLHEWMVLGAPGAPPNPVAVLQRFCDEARAAGVRIERVAAFVRTLHPHIMGRSFTWESEKEVVVREAPYEMLQSERYKASPAHAVTESRASVRDRLAATAAPRRFPVLDELASEGFTDYFASALAFLSGQRHAITFATKVAGGFRDEEIAAIEHLLHPLARLAEIFALNRTAVNVLNTYVGRNAGERILSGHIVRGHSDAIRAFIWFSDLRGFTELTSRVEPAVVIGVLNELFECQVPAIEKHGGEVLKFMGDGLLAIFPIDAPAADVAESALTAAEDAFGALDALNARRDARGDAPVKFGLALHLGDVAYGNIGGAGRLDFTCIGSAVNLAARLEGLTGKLDRKVILSDELARLTQRKLERLGPFDLKGVEGERHVYAPLEGALSRW